MLRCAVLCFVVHTVYVQCVSAVYQEELKSPRVKIVPRCARAVQRSFGEKSCFVATCFLSSSVSCGSASLQSTGELVIVSNS